MLEAFEALIELRTEDIRNEVRGLRDTLEHADRAVQALQTENQVLAARLSVAEQNIMRLNNSASAPIAPRVPTAPSMSLEKPEVFTGDRNKFNAFLS